MRHAKLVRSIARRYAGRGLAYDDIVQSGYIGLIQAVDRFDPDPASRCGPTPRARSRVRSCISFETAAGRSASLGHSRR